jgi:polysaccharide deacetylase family protein (PEP-CTERM system associated)
LKILTFDIEDWFHILDNPDTKGVTNWSNFESRLGQNMDTIFSILGANNQKATFFVVGWMAEKHPEQIRRIVENGHEIGSHTHFHQLVYEQSPKSFNEDLKRSIQTLEQHTGTKINCFRAPGFSITNATSWAIEILLENEISIDCSVFPAPRSHGGFEQFGSAKPSIIECNGMQLKEFPINTYRYFGKNLIFSGGGYFRLLPYSLIKNFTSHSDYVMTYFHPRDFDAKQPMVPGLNALRRFKSYYGLKHTEKKLKQWLSDYTFVDLKEADGLVDWSQVPIINV